MSRAVIQAVVSPKASRVSEKRCSSCGYVKPATDFSRYAYITNQGKKSERLDARCRQCNATRRMRRWNADPVASAAATRSYRDRDRAAWNMKAGVYRDQHRAGWRRCKADAQARRRAQAAGVNVDCRSGLGRMVLELARVGDRYLDAYTGDLIEKPTIDHVKALDSGGAHVYENLCVTSFSNNASKHVKPMLIWLIQKRAES